MGCLCSKRSDTEDFVAENEKEKEKDPSKSSAQVVSPLKTDEVIVGPGDKNNEASLHSRSKTSIESNMTVVPPANAEENSKTRIIERPKNGHRRNSTTELKGANGMQQPMSRILSMPNGVKGEQVAAGWPSWLSSVAAEAIKGWSPRSADSYEKLNKIGQGTYSSVYMARDLTNDKTVAMKKVRFVKMDPESVRFMAREICILRRLDHPNVMKLDAIVTSRVSGSLYLVFDYMEHDLAGLLASPRVKFTEPQIKCYMQQILSGLEHCHNRGVLHRDIKGSNLLVDNNGILKIGDFGLATTFEPGQNQPLTSRVVTLWYRAPELLLGATEYGPAIDLWSTGCILAELFAGKPIMPGRTEVEQMHKIFKLCGSPTDEYWRKTKLPHASSFKSQRTYKRRLADTFKEFPSSALALVEVLLSIDPEERGTASSALKSEFFTSNPLPCEPSNIPSYPPSKELDAKIREEEAKKRKAESVKGHGADTRSHSRQQKAVAEGQGQSSKFTSYKYNPQEGSGTGFPMEPPRGNLNNGYSHSNSMIHPNAIGYAYKKIEDDPGLSVPARSLVSFQHRGGLTRQSSQVRQSVADISDYQLKDVGRTSNNDSVGYAPKRNRILFSGPLVPPGGNMDDMLKEHERQIQEAVRKARMSKQNG
ncbi:probable serine/threonine-protein kinase At1g09600 [Sesamum indicum]|uniref:Probable Serine/threonine-protein kinase At1g09600 n=1 Tax=Sesamum indicum TaxID=4182 RepID=A0A6I9U8L9_SESIN|nr:probable serine/threonine-protein kinase At1g09600 [Sesamum indicum]XP_011095778.1 probable serine/threonine-protein kinase At1g09600 [Sesamum indicum]